MRLYLVRHGAAYNDSLTAKGKKECEDIHNQLESKGVKPKYIWHSEKKRAKETAKLLMPGSRLSEKEGLKPNDPIAPWIDTLNSTSDDLMLVGHFPFMRDLTEALTNLVVEFDNVTIVTLEGEGSEWKHLWTLSPKQL